MGMICTIAGAAYITRLFMLAIGKIERQGDNSMGKRYLK